MKTKMKLLWMILILVFIVAGCGEKEELNNTPSVSLDEIINENVEVVDEECPEGYVYDYQVSMEPIPEEIAALGGEVCGTIHAYPTEIEAALLKKEIDNDEKLQEENKRNIEGIQQYLEEMYGGEFEIVPIEKGIWVYVCTEKSTEKKFILYINPLFQKGISDDVVMRDTYLDREKVEPYRLELEQVIKEIMQATYISEMQYQEVEGADCLDLYIAVFCEKEPDYIVEQERIIEIFSAMKKVKQTSDEEIDLNLVVTYYPTNYQSTVLEQYQSTLFRNMQYISKDSTSILLENNEIYSQFKYFGMQSSDEKRSLDNIVQNREKYYESEYLLPYWRGLE